ncbi:uncharacterized protein E5676_scaffold204G001200 [Cucumis melo var. makuwa]|uniref:Uncharacterized protein n=1 Tax=Cucumis melo var. makuwa TaxID=1194695 RepID=A0A5D3D5V5_CUCMM|nr:uncharacterized protein E5676_scaffold204G001200 [Cucumis melo var. makuwa]
MVRRGATKCTGRPTKGKRRMAGVASVNLGSKNLVNSTYPKDKRVETNYALRHPADAEGWKHFNCEFSDFASNTWNMCLGLASDGFNPFGHMSISYSMWSVVLLPYNLPPWKCMKEINSLLIPGPRSPGREIDVYLQPLIKKLKELWNFRMHSYDSLTSQFFSYMHPCYGQLMTSRRMVTYQGRVQMNIRHVSYAWLIDHRLGYGVKYPSWDIDAIFQRTTCGVEVGYMMERSYVMNELSTFSSRYLNGKKTRFTRDERNDDTILEDEVIERDYQRTTQNSVVMVIGESDASGSKDNNFYGILDEVLHVQYPMEKSVWLFKCQWTDIDPTIVEGTMSSFSSSFDETDGMFLEFIEDLDNPTRGSSSVGDNSVGTSQPSTTLTTRIRVTSKSTATLRRHVSTHHTYWWNVMRTDTTSVIITWVVHSRSNHTPTRVLDRSSLTIIAAGQSHLYNDSTSSLDKKESRSTMWSCSSKHTAGFAMNFVHEGTSTTRPTMLDGANYGY